MKMLHVSFHKRQFTVEMEFKKKSESLPVKQCTCVCSCSCLDEPFSITCTGHDLWHFVSGLVCFGWMSSNGARRLLLMGVSITLSTINTICFFTLERSDTCWGTLHESLIPLLLSPPALYHK